MGSLPLAEGGPFALAGTQGPALPGLGGGLITNAGTRGQEMAAEPTAGGADWKRFVRRHGGALAVFIVACILAVAGAVYVLLWFTGVAQSGGLVPSSLGLWTMGNLVIFMVYAVLWELLLVGVPVVIGAVATWRWWKRLPPDERDLCRWRGRSRGANGGGAVSFLFFVAFCIKVYVDGNWDVPISSFTLNYVVGSMVTILEWAAVIFGVPIAVGVAWWISRELRKP